jgi:TRAP-type C4-dicarboxylate transport system substrate-binding protein
VLKKVAIDYRVEMAKATMAKAEASIKAFKAKGGKIVTLSDEEKKKWAFQMPNIAQDLAADVEKRNNYPAKQILAAYMDGLRAAGEKPVRNWDKE